MLKIVIFLVSQRKFTIFRFVSLLFPNPDKLLPLPNFIEILRLHSLLPSINDRTR